MVISTAMVTSKKDDTTLRLNIAKNSLKARICVFVQESTIQNICKKKAVSVNINFRFK